MKQNNEPSGTHTYIFDAQTDESSCNLQFPTLHCRDQHKAPRSSEKKEGTPHLEVGFVFDAPSKVVDHGHNLLRSHGALIYTAGEPSLEQTRGSTEIPPKAEKDFLTLGDNTCSHWGRTAPSTRRALFLPSPDRLRFHFPGKTKIVLFPLLQVPTASPP